MIFMEGKTMKKSKKILSALLALIMMISIVPLSSITASAETYSGTCGDNLTWTFDDFTGTLTISGIGEMYDYDFDNRPWGDFIESINAVVIENGVTTIGNYAFEYCNSLTSVIIGDSVTTIGMSAFTICESLTSIIIPDSVKTIGYNAFCECVSLASVTIGNNVTTIGDYAFGACTSLTSIIIPDSVTSIGAYAFISCYNLTNVTLGNSVTEIGERAFGYCTSLTSVIIPYSVTTVGIGVFEECTSLESVLIPDTITTISSGMFYHCQSLTSISIPDSITTIAEYAFYRCYNLKDVYYAGTEEEWNDIAINNADNANDPLLNANIHYNYHNHKYESVATSPTCTEQGYTTYTCECGDSYIDDYVDATGHADKDGNGYCDTCRELLDPTVECNCNCHKSGITKFFFNFILFFQKLFGSNRECACGVAHY